MKIGIPKEIEPGERRVAATPDSVKRLIELGFGVLVESGAGDSAGFADAEYRESGAEIAADTAAVWNCDLVTKVCEPKTSEVALLREGGVLVSLLFPAQNEELVEALAARRASVIALDAIPRVSRAQKLDVLSSMANIAGYRAVIEAANVYGGQFTAQITAAGKTPPAEVMIIGAGVAGLAAIAAARGLGAVVKAFDTRPAVKEQVESLGASFLELDFEESGEGGGGYAKVMSKEFIDAEMALFREQAKRVDVIITTALIPGKKAPTLITADMVELMKSGSVIVDLAASQGGNCEYTVPGELVDHGGVKIVGYTDLTSRMPRHASQMFSANVAHLMEEMGGGENFGIDEENEVVRGALVLRDGASKWPPPKIEVAAPPPPPPKAAAKVEAVEPESPQPAAPSRGLLPQAIGLLVVAGILVSIGRFAPPEFVQHFTVFVLAVFIGYQVVWSVTPALHTPLMSVTNAISGIILVGGLLVAASGKTDLAAWLGTIAVFVASINVFGGFLVTHRMLKMFRK
ncbi:MAG: Re/Si-specific NAD(P)(+) transhydrogenase subunit alpha [Deltaproteobacteria bacterium]|jgi:NAD(P) transhydrogenase subunit alpha|nr:Re/Si-specific NAD(P)(+) transhydrogenase subunit alpha [Deltaproteobacteria bacterium]